MSTPSASRTLVVYGATIAGAAVVFESVRRYGSHLAAPPSAGAAHPHATPAHGGSFLEVLVALAAVIVVARLFGMAFKRLHQPPVVGEVVAGLALGPSLLGRFAPGVAEFVLPASVAPKLAVIAQIGVVLFMFLVGLELDTSRLKKRTHAIVAVSHASIVVPFLLGSVLALWLYPRLSSAEVPFSTFALFVGISLSVTAFPVLARILTDRGIHRTPLGITALTCAAVADVTAWCMLAFLASITSAHASGIARTLVWLGVYLAGMLLVVRPLAAHWVRRFELKKELPSAAIAVALVGLLLSALATEAIGIHAIFGAFLLGAIVPHDSLLARELNRRLEDAVVVLFLPAFFAFTGMRTEVALLSSATHWAICAGIIVLASVGKFGGSFVAARLTGIPTREALSLGILMNTRGLVELVVLNLGLDLGLVSPTLFAMLVLMAVVTTLATTPLLDLFGERDTEATAAANPRSS
jgi:Kef-type K+ transport system membrane component KefB